MLAGVEKEGCMHEGCPGRRVDDPGRERGFEGPLRVMYEARLGRMVDKEGRVCGLVWWRWV